MGRSVAEIHLRGTAASTVLGVTYAYGVEKGLRADEGSSDHITLSRGDELLTSRRAIRVTAFDAHGGANVRIEAWAESWPWASSALIRTSSSAS